MADGGGTADESSGPEDDEHPSLRDLVAKVNERRGRRPDRPTSPSTASSADRSDLPPRDPETGQFRPKDAGSGEPADAFGTDPKTEALLELVEDAPSVLLLGPLLTPADYDLCTRLSTAPPAESSNLLLVTLTESPDKRIAVFQGYLDDLPAETAILNVGDSVRSGTKETFTVSEGGVVTVETISDPTDMMRMGITISRIISDWEEDGEDAVVCFHSLTALLQFAPDSKTVFRFLHVLRGRLQAAGASAHFHMDPAAHDEQTIETFRALFDEVLRFDEGGSIQVHH